MITIGYVFLTIHIVLILIAFILMKLRVLLVDKTMFAFIVLIPIWGMLSAVVVSIMVHSGRAGIKGRDLEAMKNNNSGSGSIIVEAPESENVLPLQDALIMDDAKVKRSVMLDVLMNNTSGYISVINEARMNDDVEVVHYATTAMVELSKEYELKAQDFSSRYAEDPWKEGLLDDYVKFLEQYVYSGMIQGQLLEIQRNTLMQLLAEKVSRNGMPDDYSEFVKTLLTEKHYSGADQVLSEMEKKFPENEECIKLRMRYYYDTGAGNKIKEMVRKVKEEGNYYSREIREMAALWDNEPKEQRA